MEANKIIITGAATRMGAAIAKKLSGPNVEIVIHYNRSKVNAEKLQKQLKKDKTKVVFSGRPAIHVHDQANDRILDAHQETNQFARDTIVLWIPLFDTNTQTGGLKIYEKSHLNGYLKHSLEHPRLGKKAWTNKYTHIEKKYLIFHSFDPMILRSHL